MKRESCCVVSSEILSQTELPTAGDYANALLRSLGISENVTATADHPATAWRRAGLDKVTGLAGSEALVAPVALTIAADGAMLALKSTAPSSAILPENGSLLLGERARLMGLKGQGCIAPGGSCYLLETLDGAIAINLAREDDWSLLPVWLQIEAVETIDQAAQILHRWKTNDLVDRGIEMGLPLAKIDPPRRQDNWLRIVATGPKTTRQRERPLVVDLSSLWAGPLAGNLLSILGADVIKVESLHRPDGARDGNEKFYSLLNGGKKSVALDFTSDEGRRKLKALLTVADIVVEGSRPRALRQLGIDAEAFVRKQEGKVWVSITAYGRDQENEMRIGFGDDVAAGAGLVSLMRDAYGSLMFCGDAIADPMTGLHAALAGWSAWQEGGGVLLDISMNTVMAHAIAFDSFALEAGKYAIRDRALNWGAITEEDKTLYAMRSPIGRTHSLGEDTNAVFSRFLTC